MTDRQTQTTHAQGCWSWGPGHFECALREIETLQASKSQLEAQNLELQRLANHDQLTSLLNRRAFFEQGEKLVAACRKQGSTLVCIMCDIDHFKSINDTHGHPVGDEAIKVVSSLLRSAVRPMDLVGRYGGEEFCVLLPGLPEDLALKVAERIRAKIEAQAGRGVRSVEGLRITSSFGLTSLKLGAESLPALIEQADEALYRSKKGGRNRVTVFAPDANAPSPERSDTGADKLQAEIEALRAEVERLRPMTAVTLGIGKGGGNLFVHGDYDSIKAAQSLVFRAEENEALRAEVKRLRADLAESDAIREKLRQLLTLTAKALKGEPPEDAWHSWHDLPEKAAQLVGALRKLEGRKQRDEALLKQAMEALLGQRGNPDWQTSQQREAAIAALRERLWVKEQA